LVTLAILITHRFLDTYGVARYKCCVLCGLNCSTNLSINNHNNCENDMLGEHYLLKSDMWTSTISKLELTMLLLGSLIPRCKFT
jgi:hypothetical protein